jgi:hypothetical protein
MATVESVLGVSEEELVCLDAASRAAMVIEGDAYAFVHRDTGARTSAGRFTCPSVAQLRAAVHLRHDNDKDRDQGGLDQVIGQGKGQGVGSRVPLELLVGVDVAALQASLTTEDRAMVQVASNFNCLEVASEHVRPNCGFLVDGASTDVTQGPAAVFGTLSAYLWRAHFCIPGHTQVVELEGGLEERRSYGSQTGGVSAETNINLLRDVREFCGVPITGKLRLTGDEKVVPEELQQFVDRVRVGLHTDCPVMFGRKGRRIFPLHPAAQPLIDHVLSASVDMRRPGFPLRGQDAEALRLKTGTKDAPLLSLCRGLLRAAYEGAYLAARLRQSRVLYLTLVGGGSFANPLPLIVQEIARAHDMYAGPCLKHVVLCVYSAKQAEQVRRLLRDSGTCT